MGELIQFSSLQRKAGLQQKTALATKTELTTKKPLRRKAAIKTKGAAATRKASFMAACRASVLLRAGGKCEACGATGTPEWNHIFGRSLGVAGGHLWPHVPELTMGLCRDCHRHWHEATVFGVKLVEHWRWLAAQRLRNRYKMEAWPGHADPWLVVRATVAALIADNVEAQP